MSDNVVLDGDYFLRGSEASLLNFIDIVETEISDDGNSITIFACLGIGMFLGAAIGYKYFHPNNGYIQIP